MDHEEVQSGQGFWVVGFHLLRPGSICLTMGSCLVFFYILANLFYSIVERICTTLFSKGAINHFKIRGVEYLPGLESTE